MSSLALRRTALEKENDRCHLNSRPDSKLSSALLIKQLSLVKDDLRTSLHSGLPLKSHSLCRNLTSALPTLPPLESRGNLSFNLPSLSGLPSGPARVPHHLTASLSSTLNVASSVGDTGAMLQSTTHLRSPNLKAFNSASCKIPPTASPDFAENYGRKLIEDDVHLSRTAIHLHPRSDFLHRHEITAKLRARMLDWMVEVISSYRFQPKTYFACVQLMDRYFEAESKPLQASSLHISGVVAILIASKMEEVFPLKLRIVFEKIVHCKITIQEMVAKEARMSELLEYKLNSWTFFDLAQTKAQIHLKADYTALLAYLGKFLAFDYGTYHEESHETLADGLLTAALEVSGDACPRGVITAPTEAVTKVAARILTLAKDFETLFPRLENIFKFESEEVQLRVDNALRKQ